MICKYCGADMPETAKKCPRCGEANPAKSDCGGFYDLVHTKPKAAPIPVMNPGAPPVAPAPAPAPVPEKKGFFPLEYDLFAVIVCGVMLLLLIMNIVLLVQIGKVNRLAEENAAAVSSLNNDVDDIDDKTPQGTKPQGTEPQGTEPEGTQPDATEPDNTQQPDNKGEAKNPWKDRITEEYKNGNGGIQIDLTKQSVQISLDEEEKGTVSGDDLKGVVVMASEEKGGFLEQIHFDVDGNGDDFSIIVTNEKQEGKQALIVVKVETLSGLIFGNRDQDEDLEFEWKCREIGTEEWKSLSKGDFKVCKDEDKLPSFSTGVFYGKDSMNYELQLEITRKNEDGGSLTITIDGMAITETVLDSILGTEE